VNLWRTLLVGLLSVALPLSATASLTAALSCPHQGFGAAAMADAHAHVAMAAAMHHDVARAQAHHDAASTSAHHACDCVHHCAGANHAVNAPTLIVGAFTGPTAVLAFYRFLHAVSSEPPLLRPPISIPAA
jgi:hypothetical protein